MSWISYPRHHGCICKVASLIMKEKKNAISHATCIDIQIVAILPKIHLGIREKNTHAKPVTWYFKPLMLLVWLMSKHFTFWDCTNTVVREVRGNFFFHSDEAEAIMLTLKNTLVKVLDVIRDGCSVGIYVKLQVSGWPSWQIHVYLHRMALEIGLNREPGLAYKDRPLSTAQWMQHEVQRQLFWSIFAVDR